MPQAGCLCGAVTWQLEGELQLMSHCHCSRCRKQHGVAFATYAGVREENFRLAGGEQIARWESSPGFHRSFCRTCGSVVPSGVAVDGWIYVPVGNIDGDPQGRPLAHIFAASKAPWFEISDDLPRFDAYPEGFDAPVVADREPVDPPGQLRGSCLCGDVAFVVEGELQRSHHCHCRRCRLARSAAFATNLFTTADGVRFTRGQDRLGSYKIPDAKYFTQVFCRSCGSKMPRISPERNMAVIPMGALDDEPAMKPQSHIFVGSKAPWFEITDDLPQYEQAEGR